ncbi:unnamed protein product [Candida verbasci]|uniref:Rap-GAP domain-containing protein n=1 Tax=Candida verbasci TaxID=1227364 RepID=A0A9W4TZ60_9ASCO|nr:unnamed protein product [Candida verbasci]
MSTHHPNFGSSGLGSVFKSLTKSFKPSSSKNVPVSINPTVVGGSEDLQIIIKHLQTTTSQSNRIELLIKLTEQIENYSISSIQEIWYTVRPYCKSQSSQIRTQGLKLCIACISKDDNSVGTRVRYFNDLYDFNQSRGNQLDSNFNLIMKGINLLTNNGRDIHDYLIYDDKKDLCKFIADNLKIVQILSSREDKNSQNCIDFLVFIRNCLKFNYTVVSEDSLTSILNRLVQFKSKNKQVLTSLLEIFDAVAVFGHVPIDITPKLITFIAEIYGTSIDADINSAIIKSIDDICIEENCEVIIFTLCDNISNPDVKIEKYTNACIGSIKLLKIIIVKNAIENKFKMEFAYFRVVKSLKAVLSFNIPIINSSYIDCLDKLLAKDSYQDNFGMTLHDSIDKVIPFQIWYSNTNSMYDVLSLLKINNEQDKNRFQSICLSLQQLYENHELQTPKDKLINFFINFNQYITRENMLFVLQYYDDEKLCTMLNPLYKEESIKLLNYFYYDNTNPEVKVKCLEVILNGYEISKTIFNDVSSDLILDIFKKSVKESNEEVLDFLIYKMFCNFLTNCDSKIFQNLTNFLLPLVNETQSTDALIARSFVSSVSSSNSSKGYLEKITKAICTTFIKSNARRSFECFEILIEIAKRTQSGEILLIISKCLIRIRTTSEFYIYITQPFDMIGLASAFKRDNKIVAGQQWTYPETVDYLPETYYNKPNKNLLLLVGEPDFDKNYIDIKKWFSLVLTIMKNFVAWEVYSYVWAHFCAQLSNMTIFNHCNEEIINLKNIVCDQLTLKLPSNLNFQDSELTKSDLQVAFVRSFSALMGYHDKFSKSDEDQIINSLIFGLNSWEKTSIPCLNILTICCYEIPLSVKKYLSLILTNLQTKVTSANASTHTLEFLMSLVNLPVLTSNFTMEEFKRVFGIAFKYIQFSIDLETRNLSPVNTIQQHGVDATVEQTPSTQSSGISPILSQYIMKLSYNVISHWFLKINMNDRKIISSFLIKNLISINERSSLLSDQTIGFLDFITKFTYSDLPLKIINSTIQKQNENTTINKWVIADSIVSIESDLYSADTDILIRKPTGVSRLVVQLDHQEQSDSSIVISPNYFLLQLFDCKTKPIPIIEDQIVSRALNVLDRIPSVEFHKIGIVYIGKNQTNENEVLNNKVGSSEYQNFLNNIGDLVKLKNNKEIYLGGLDNERDIDGEYSRFWRDKTTQVIFHVTTMMNNPNLIKEDADSQRTLDLKKRHIGNNYVNIFFDESGEQDFNFNLIKSQFNFLSVVIKPHTKTEELTIPSNSQKKFFKVKTYRRSGVPAILATCHFKIVSLDQLPNVIRNLVILASEFANVWHSNNLSGKFISNWAQRVKQLKILKNKSLENYKNLQNEEENNYKADKDKINSGNVITQSFFEQLNENSNLNLNTNSYNDRKLNDYKFEFLNDKNEDAKLFELYKTIEFNSYTS